MQKFFLCKAVFPFAEKTAEKGKAAPYREKIRNFMKRRRNPRKNFPKKNGRKTADKNFSLQKRSFLSADKTAVKGKPARYSREKQPFAKELLSARFLYESRKPPPFTETFFRTLFPRILSHPEDHYDRYF